MSTLLYLSVACRAPLASGPSGGSRAERHTGGLAGAGTPRLKGEGEVVRRPPSRPPGSHAPLDSHSAVLLLIAYDCPSY